MEEEKLRHMFRECILEGAELEMYVRLNGPEIETVVDKMIEKFEKSGIIKKTYIDGEK